ncbi:MAG TPA: T9SS type A sorting domain-containing protein [Chitinophagales bacterium]|nr:T9SS type A sorting domain-containing protein [Chitinophagales bacterium]
MHTTTQAAFEARTILYLLRGEEYPVLLPPMPAIINPALMQGVAINFKNTTFNLNKSDELVSKPYPNPVNGVLYLDTKLPNVEIVEFELYDIAGKLQYAQTLSGDAKHAINLTHLSSGMYFCHLTYNNGATQNFKLILSNR